MKNINRTWFWLVLIAIVSWFIWGRSEQGPRAERTSVPAELSAEATTEERDQLKDGSYDCTVSNTDRANGPYTLTCDKSGDEIKINFPNGGYRTISVDEPQHEGAQFTFEGTDDRLAETWEIEITK